MDSNERPELENDGGLAHVDRCLYCGSADHKIEADGVSDFYFSADSSSFTFLRCQGCGSLWIDRRPVGDRLVQAYSTYFTHAAPPPPRQMSGLRGWLHKAYVSVKFRKSANLVERLAVIAIELTGRNNTHIDEQFRFAPRAPAHILDYGCGSGEYLLKMQPLGYMLTGAEYDPQVLANLAEFGIEIVDVAKIGENCWLERFDHITLSHVLEHVPEPVALLQRLHRALNPGGTLFLEVPNADATGLAIFGRFWRGLEAPRHFSLPNRASLISALEDAGFDVEYQHINISARERAWSASFEQCGEDERGVAQKAMDDAPEEEFDNAEFLTFVARKPE